MSFQLLLLRYKVIPGTYISIVRCRHRQGQGSYLCIKIGLGTMYSDNTEANDKNSKVGGSCTSANH